MSTWTSSAALMRRWRAAGERPIRNVTENLRGGLDGDAGEQRAAIQTLNRLFQQARHRQRTGMGDRVWVRALAHRSRGLRR